MAAVARNTGRYWRMYKQGLLVKLVNAALGVTGLENHSLTVKTGGVTANQLIDVQQSAWAISPASSACWWCTPRSWPSIRSWAC
jgi:hypothetical protein